MRVPVSMTEGERKEIEAGAQALGFRSLSDFMRYAALVVSRGSKDDN